VVWTEPDEDWTSIKAKARAEGYEGGDLTAISWSIPEEGESQRDPRFA
jgi:hypothetical protein